MDAGLRPDAGRPNLSPRVGCCTGGTLPIPISMYDPLFGCAGAVYPLCCEKERNDKIKTILTCEGHFDEFVDAI